MSEAIIKAFSDKARSDTELGLQLKECMKIKEILQLGKDHGFEMDEVSMYPPNEPQFTDDQLSERMVKALLR